MDLLCTANVYQTSHGVRVQSQTIGSRNQMRQNIPNLCTMVIHSWAVRGSSKDTRGYSQTRDSRWLESPRKINAVVTTDQISVAPLDRDTHPGALVNPHHSSDAISLTATR